MALHVPVGLVLPVPVVLLAQAVGKAALAQPARAHLVQVSAALVRVALQVVHPAVLQVLLVQVVAQVEVAVAALVAEPPVPSVRAAARVARLESQSARNAKSTSRELHLR
jgi:hypothetical protein